MLNIVQAWRACTEEERRRGCTWYDTAQAHAIYLSWTTAGPGLHWELPTVAGVIAALSPGLAWRENLVAARLLLSRRGFISVPGYGPNKKKAERIMAGESPEAVLGGKKVTAFYRLIRDGGNPEDVCVDGHALNMALGRGKLRIDSSYATPAEGDLVREGFRAAGHYLGVWPCKVQSATWLAWRASQGFAQGRLPF